MLDLSLEELDDFYNQSLFDFENEDNKKAGLGVIDLRIKSENKINFEFYEMSKDRKFFVLQTKVEIK